jgi:anaerobic magnesium-protoporphyrin IX monomethyl ester cyclase
MSKQNKKIKILFINPPLSAEPNTKFLNHQIPLGFLYMAGVLEKKGFIVKILDCPLYYTLKRKSDNLIKIGLFPEQIKQEIIDFNPDIVGVNCSFTMFESDSFEVIDLVKKINKNIKIIVGGAHVSANPEFVLRNKKIDLAVTGEGELTMLEIAQKIRDNKSLQNIKGTAIILNKKMKKNPSRELIQNLDELEPAWHLIDFKKYFEHPDSSSVAMRTPSVHLITSRGCPGNCVFCSVHTVWGRKWRAMSPEKVVNQIEYLYKKYGVKHFRFNDDNLTLDKKRIIKICQLIIGKKIDIKWDTPSGVALWTLDREVLLMMKKAGYYRITFGIESGCEKTRRYIGKNFDMKKVEELIDYCNEIGLWVASFFIIGFPNESKKELNETCEYIVNSKINFPFIFLAQPYPGTRMYFDFINAGLLDEVRFASTFVNSKYNSKYFTGEELNGIRAKIYKDFYLKKIRRYLNPFIFYKELFSKIRNYEDLMYVLKIVKSLITTFNY